MGGAAEPGSADILTIIGFMLPMAPAAVKMAQDWLRSKNHLTLPRPLATPQSVQRVRLFSQLGMEKLRRSGCATLCQSIGNSTSYTKRTTRKKELETLDCFFKNFTREF
jgi:hypothetical protein